MGSLHVWHGDILDFITCKNKLDSDNEKVYNQFLYSGDYTEEELKAIERTLVNSQLTNFNLSVMVDKEFMDAVENDEIWELYNPKTEELEDLGEDLYGIPYYKGGRLSKGEKVGEIRARELWDIIINNAWENGDPGILYIDNMEKGNPTPTEPYESVNPCVTGDTLILTKEGNIPIKDLVDKEVEIWNGYEWSKVTPKVTGRNQEILDIELSNGGKLSCTLYHKFVLKDGERVKAEDLKIGDVLEEWDYIVDGKKIKYSDVYVTSITKRDEVEDKVYCFNEPKNHTGVFNGIMTAQCGEQPLLDEESCNLGSIDLAKHTKYNEDKGCYEVDWEGLEYTVETMVRLLDNVIDVNTYPIKSIERKTKDTRKIGLGVMGWAKMLMKLRIPYDSKGALELAEQLSKFIQTVSHETSLEIGKEKGSFPRIEDSIWKGTTMRNATTTTIAPTGSIALLAETSGGIEPEFALAFTRLVDANTPDEREYTFKNSELQKDLDRLGLDRKDIWDKIVENGGKVRGLKEIPEDIQEIYGTSMDIDPLYHVFHQASWQKGVDNAISKTINLPSSATREDISEIYKIAHKLGLKGVTVYRDGSKYSQVLSTKSSRDNSEYKLDKKLLDAYMGSSPKSVEICPECGTKVHHMDGCWTCPGCGMGQCSI